MSPAPLLISVPSGLIVSGVATWAARLASAMAASGRRAGLILHAPPPGHTHLDIELHPEVAVFDLSKLPRFEDIAGHARTPIDTAAAREAWVRAYTDAARAMARRAPGSPVVLSPNLHADCYATCTQVARRHPDLVRLIGWQHNDIEYDRRVLAHYEPALAAVAGVSDHIVSLLRTLLPDRRVASIPYGVETPDLAPARPPLSTARGSRPVRLLYTGRLDHHQKRILALPHLSRTLTDLGIDHELTILGDGPAAADLIREIERVPAAQAPAPSHTRAARAGADPSAARSHTGVTEPMVASRAPRPIRLAGSATPRQVRAALAGHDAFVLPSRFEGLSVSMLEALAAGCVPIVARVASGALQAIDPGASGLIADVGPESDEADVGRALAEQVARFLASDTRAMSAAAWRSAHTRFSLDTHVRAAAALIDEASARPPASWPASRPAWFTDIGGSIPADAPSRLAAALERLAGRPIAVHGAGLHTRTLLDQLLAGPARIVALTDDDRQRHGEHLGGVPVIDPTRAAAAGATDVLISTSMHEEAVWAGRAVYERQGLRVHRLYA